MAYWFMLMTGHPGNTRETQPSGQLAYLILIYIYIHAYNAYTCGIQCITFFRGFNFFGCFIETAKHFACERSLNLERFTQK